MDNIKFGKILTLLRTSPKLSFITKLIIYIIKTGYSIHNITKQINRPQSGIFHNKILGSVSSPSVPPVPEKYFPTTGEQCLVENSPIRATPLLKCTCNGIQHHIIFHTRMQSYMEWFNVMHEMRLLMPITRVPTDSLTPAMPSVKTSHWCFTQ